MSRPNYNLRLVRKNVDNGHTEEKIARADSSLCCHLKQVSMSCPPAIPHPAWTCGRDADDGHTSANSVHVRHIQAGEAHSYFASVRVVVCDIV